jgi:hypothetical protein
VGHLNLENILFMFHHIHVTFKFREFGADASNIFKLEVSFEHPTLVAPLSWQVDGIVGQTNTQSNPPFHVDHANAI